MQRIILVFILSVFAFNALISQETKQPAYYLGIWGAYGLNSHNGGFEDFPEAPGCCGNYGDGNGTGLGLGLLFDIRLNDDFDFISRLGWHKLDGAFKTTEVIGNTEIRELTTGETSYVGDVTAEYALDGYLGVLNFEPGINYNFFGNFGLAAGVTIGVLTNNTYDRKETLLSPAYVVYKVSGTRVRNEIYGSEIPEANSLQFGAFAGLDYDVSLSERVFLSPEVRYYIPFTQVRSFENEAENWTVSRLHFGLALKVAFYKSEKEIIERETILRDTTEVFMKGLDKERIVKTSTDIDISETEEFGSIIRNKTITERYERQIPEASELFADVKLYGIDNDGNKIADPKIIIEEFEVEESFPLLPHIYFAEGSAELNNTSQDLLTPSAADEFTEAALEWNTLDIYSEMLNIIASRMEQFPEASITITGTNNNMGVEENNLGLSMQRANSVKKYLTDVWGIDPSRIDTKSRNMPEKPANNDRNDGRVENRRAEISSNTWQITKPVYLKSVERTANPPQVEITPIVKSDAGIKKWSLSVSEEGSRLRNYEGTTMPEPIVWQVAQSPVPQSERLVNVQMSASDKNNKTVNVSKELSIEQLTIKKKRFEMLDDKQIQRYSLIVFDYDKSNLTANHRRILDEIKENIQPNSQVKILGYADRTGEAAYNKTLAQKRSDEVAEYLNLSRASYATEGIGNDELLYDNDIPQGRAYSRTVKIIIETPIER